MEVFLWKRSSQYSYNSTLHCIEHTGRAFSKRHATHNSLFFLCTTLLIVETILPCFCPCLYFAPVSPLHQIYSIHFIYRVSISLKKLFPTAYPYGNKYVYIWRSKIQALNSTIVHSRKPEVHHREYSNWGKLAYWRGGLLKTRKLIMMMSELPFTRKSSKIFAWNSTTNF